MSWVRAAIALAGCGVLGVGVHQYAMHETPFRLKPYDPKALDSNKLTLPSLSLQDESRILLGDKKKPEPAKTSPEKKVHKPEEKTGGEGGHMSSLQPLATFGADGQLAWTAPSARGASLAGGSLEAGAALSVITGDPIAGTIDTGAQHRGTLDEALALSNGKVVPRGTEVSFVLGGGELKGLTILGRSYRLVGGSGSDTRAGVRVHGFWAAPGSPAEQPLDAYRARSIPASSKLRLTIQDRALLQPFPALKTTF